MEQSKIINLETAIQFGIQGLTKMENRILSLIAQQKRVERLRIYCTYRKKPFAIIDIILKRNWICPMRTIVCRDGR